MEFWGAEVKVGESVKVDPEEFEACIHLSQAALGEAKKDKANEPVVLNLKVGDQKFVLGTLSRDKIPQISLELVLEKEFELSHNSKTSSVFFCGYRAYYADEEGEEDDFTDSDEDIPLTNTENGKPETKAEDLKVSESKKADAKSGAAAKQVKVVEPKKDEEEDSDDESDEDLLSSDNEMDDADSDSDEEDESEDDKEETPKKADQGKKRPNESASKTPVSTKKAKNATPEKTDGKKTGHTATPHPAKKGGKTPKSEAKTPKSEAKDQTPKSGGLSCKSCSKSFNSESGLQQHNKAKHGGQ